MAVRVGVSDHAALLRKMRELIEEGEIETWEVDDDGDFTHCPPQWRHKAWLRPSAREGGCDFFIMAPQGVHLSKTVYAVYHGRFIEMLLAHFDVDLSQITATPLPVLGDRIVSSTT